MLAIAIVIIFHHQFHGHEFEQVLEDSGGQRSLQSVGSQIVKRDLVTEQQQKCYFCRNEIFVVITWRDLLLPLLLLSASFASGSTQTGTLEDASKIYLLVSVMRFGSFGVA